MQVPAPVSTPAYITAIPAYISALVAVLVCFVAYQQWRTAREKLRLDLYNRRFDIYLNTLAFVQALQMWKDTPEQEALVIPFIKAFRESLFLFRRDSGIYQVLQELHTRAFDITKYKEVSALTQSTPESPLELFEKRTDTLIWVGTVPDTLEILISPYLNFHLLTIALPPSFQLSHRPPKG